MELIEKMVSEENAPRSALLGDDLEAREANNSNNQTNETKGTTGLCESAEDSNNNHCSSTKRKLPAWMLSASEDEVSSKKSKHATTESAAVDCIDSNDIDNAAGTSCKTTETNQSNSVDSSVSSTVKIKTEPINSIDEQPSTSANQVSTSATNDSVGTVKIKAEPVENNSATSSPSKVSIADIKPAIKVEKADATSTSVNRSSCKYGIRCYRRNPMHRVEEAHPGDSDYRRPTFPAPPIGTPDCPFGNACYRRNPIHFQQYSHPVDTDFEQNYKNYRMRLRQRRQQLNNSNDDDAGSELDDYDFDDPFIDDGDSEYMPSNDDDDDEEYDDDGEDDLDNENNDVDDDDDDDDDEMDKAEE